MELFEFAGDKDMANQRTVTLDNGITVKLERRDPYGLVWSTWEGKTPLEFEGASFTSFEEAYKGLKAYNTKMKNLQKK